MGERPATGGEHAEIDGVGVSERAQHREQALALLRRVEQQAGVAARRADAQRRRRTLKGGPMTNVRSWQFWVIVALALATMACAGRRARREQVREERRERAEQRRAERQEQLDRKRAE